MGQTEGNLLGVTEMTGSVLLQSAALPSMPPGEGKDGPGAWESAWIDLGGEG